MTYRRTLMISLAVSLVLAACGGGDDTSSTTTTVPSGAYGAQVASYDLSADGPQRFLVGLLGPDKGLIVGGAVTLDFRYFGADASETNSSSDGELLLSDVHAAFVPVADGIAPPDGDGPRIRTGNDGVGVYEARDVQFEKAGFWSVTVKATIADEPAETTAAFQVADQHRIVAAGDPAPRTENLLPGNPDAPPKAVDSRAEDNGDVPDPELHRLTVAAAIASGNPTIVVVSTPVFCVSRFCGPITDAVQRLAARYEGQANFVHIEVWRDFEANTLNKGAAEWIYPDTEVDPAEPWVFLVDGSGTVVERWDNVANSDSIDAALQALLG